MGLALIPGFGSLGGMELIIALVIILLLFGAKRIPELARSLGSGVREFREETREEVEEERKEEELPGDEKAQADSPDPHAEDASVEADQAEQKQR